MSPRSRGKPIQPIFDLTRGKPLKGGSGVPRMPGGASDEVRHVTVRTAFQLGSSGEGIGGARPGSLLGQTVRVAPLQGDLDRPGGLGAINGLGTGAATADSTDRGPSGSATPAQLANRLEPAFGRGVRREPLEPRDQRFLLSLLEALEHLDERAA